MDRLSQSCGLLAIFLDDATRHGAAGRFAKFLRPFGFRAGSESNSFTSTSSDDFPTRPSLGHCVMVSRARKRDEVAKSDPIWVVETID